MPFRAGAKPPLDRQPRCRRRVPPPHLRHRVFHRAGRRTRRVTRHRSPRVGVSPPMPRPSSGWPASWPPNAARPSMPAAKPSWNRSSVKCRPCRTPNTSCCAGSSKPAGNGCCWPPATTFENCTATSRVQDWPPYRPTQPPAGRRTASRCNRAGHRPTVSSVHPKSPRTRSPRTIDNLHPTKGLPTHAPRRRRSSSVSARQDGTRAVVALAHCPRPHGYDSAQTQRSRVRCSWAARTRRTMRRRRVWRQQGRGRLRACARRRRGTA